MSVLDSNVIDAVSRLKESNAYALTIFDHLPWDDDIGGHLDILQDKINTYISFYESGEIYSIYPDLKSASIYIEVVCKFSPDDTIRDFFDKVSEIIEPIGLHIFYRLASD